MVWREEVPEPKRMRRKPLQLITICRREEPSTTLLWEPTNITLGLLRLLRPRQGREEASGESHVRDRPLWDIRLHSTTDTMYILREWKSWQSRGRVCPSLLLLVHSWTADSTSNKNTADWILLMMDSDDSSDGLKIRHKDKALPREPSLSWYSWLDKVAELLADVSVSASFPIEPFPGWVSCQSCYSLWPNRWFFEWR